MLYLVHQPAGEPKWRLLTTLSGYSERTIFSVDWSRDGHIASGSADNSISVFSSSENSVDAEGTGSSLEDSRFDLQCRKEAAHLLDVNSVRWSPSDPTLLASAGDDCAIKLWRYSPPNVES
jgi:cytosolic iron-sulfur protein assembly protein CIAO1